MNAIDRLDAWLRISPSTVLPSEVLEYLDDIKAENEKLQEEIELVGTAGYLLAMKQLKAENEKLRAERDEWHRVAKSKQDIIDHMRDANAKNTKLRKIAEDIYKKDMRELGIEENE